MTHPIVRFAFAFAFTAWILWWLESHSMVVTTTVDLSGSTTTVVDLVADEVITPETSTPTPTPTPTEVQND